MNIEFSERLQEERQRLGLSQEVLAAFGQVQKRAQIYYEQGERFPDARYLAGVANAGVDVPYLLTGVRSPTAGVHLSPKERTLIEKYRAASTSQQRAIDVMVGALASTDGRTAKPAQEGHGSSVQIGGDVRSNSTITTGGNVGNARSRGKRT